MDSDSVLPLSESFQLPLIDLSDQTLKPGSSKWDEVKTHVRKALEDYGCFEASYDNVSTELKKSVFEAMEELFELPIQTKQRNVSSKPYHGYLCHNLYQSLGIDDATVLEKVNDFTQQLWADQGNKTISETIHRFSEQLWELDMMVRRMIMESFGLEKYIDEHLNSTNYLLRLMKYTSPPDDDDDDGLEETKFGLRAHTDKNILTILHQFQVDGLEVKTKDEKWIKVKPSQDSFLVMVGDSLGAFLNGRLSSPYHRVMMMGKKTRYSTALFSVPKTGVIVDSPEELIDEEHPRIFKPYQYDDFLQFFQTEAGRRAQSPFHAFAALSNTPL
ncbi:putative 2-oxoglutarate-dependent dioxygenase AOP1.2 [Cardamine amara subsp. amara]|uniref:2-oxoglutarate-dependent dioxygenase AOP1.2 n=2 Tax=Cardamine amara subsp. amara TaxID=228776 RepID=A0ABD1BEA4_CARAN